MILSKTVCKTEGLSLAFSNAVFSTVFWNAPISEPSIISDTLSKLKPSTDSKSAMPPEAASVVAAATTEAASGGMADLLSVDGFNLDKVSEMIDGSEIGAFQKTVLKTALEKAKDNPSVLQTVLDKIKEAAGL